MMRRNVTEHYGQSSFGSLAVCAKSGTAEVGSDARPHSWFTGFVDDADHPLAFVVVVENGGSGRIRGRQCRSQSTDCSCRSRLLSRNNGCCISLQAAIVPFLLFPIQNFFEILWFFLSFSLLTG